MDWRLPMRIDVRGLIHAAALFLNGAHLTVGPIENRRSVTGHVAISNDPLTESRIHA